MSPGGAGCANRLLLTVGWLLLAGLQSACGSNVTAAQDPGLAPLGEGENEGEEEAESESEAENEAQAVPEEDGEGGKLFDVGQLRVKPCPPKTMRIIDPVNICRALLQTASNLYFFSYA